MLRLLFWVVILSLPASGAERVFQFGDGPPGQQPRGFQSFVAGTGEPGDWKIVLEDAPAPLEPLSSKAPANTKRAVLAQTTRQAIENRFPVLVFEEETYQDFRLTTRFKIVGGAMEQMAGVVFRFQNASNFYVVRASVPGRSFQCYKIENGVWKPPIGPSVEIAKDQWHELTVQCEGPRIICYLNGQELIKLVDQAGVRSGHIGFLTRADSVSYFVDTRIIHATRDVLAQALVRDALKDYPRLAGVQVFAIRPGDTDPVIVAASNDDDLEKPGTDAEKDVIANARTYYSRSGGVASVTLPLRDRNGDPIAAVRVSLRTFPGQTKQNALVRAQPIVRKMQSRVLSREELLR